MSTPEKHIKDNQRFQELLTQIKYMVAHQADITDMFLLAEDAIGLLPQNAKLVLDAIETKLPNTERCGKIFDILAKQRDDLIDDFMGVVFVPKAGHEDFIFNLLNRFAIRSNLGVIKKAVAHMADFDQEVVNDALKRLLGTAITDVMLGRNQELFNYLLSREDIIHGTWEVNLKNGSKGRGNALLLWATLTPIDIMGQANGPLVLKQLLNCGVNAEDPIIKTTPFNKIIEYADLMVFLCHHVDVFNISYLHVVDQLINEGVSWQGVDQGNGEAAKHIQEHPIVKAHDRRKALEQVMEEVSGGGSRKTTRRSNL